MAGQRAPRALDPLVGEWLTGYTLLVNSSSHSIVPATYNNLPFDTLRDFAPIVPLGNMPTVLVVSPSKGYRNLADLVLGSLQTNTNFLNAEIAEVIAPVFAIGVITRFHPSSSFVSLTPAFAAADRAPRPPTSSAVRHRRFGAHAQRQHHALFHGFEATDVEMGLRIGEQWSQIGGSFTKGLGAKTPEFGVRVVAVHPPATRTDRIMTLVRSVAKQKYGDESRVDDVLKDGTEIAIRAIRPEDRASVFEAFKGLDPARVAAGQQRELQRGDGHAAADADDQHRLAQDLVLVGEVPIERRRGDPDTVDDPPDGGGSVALRQEQIAGRGQFPVQPGDFAALGGDDRL